MSNLQALYDGKTGGRTQFEVVTGKSPQSEGMVTNSDYLVPVTIAAIIYWLSKSPAWAIGGGLSPYIWRLRDRVESVVDVKSDIAFNTLPEKRSDPIDNKPIADPPAHVPGGRPPSVRPINPWGRGHISPM